MTNNAVPAAIEPGVDDTVPKKNEDFSIDEDEYTRTCGILRKVLYQVDRRKPSLKGFHHIAQGNTLELKAPIALHPVRAKYSSCKQLYAYRA